MAIKRESSRELSGESVLIHSLKEFDIPKEQILQKLQDTYELAEEEARVI